MNATGARVTTHRVAPLAALVQAPAHWHCIDFISDLHLQTGDKTTFNTWQHFMQNTPANAVFILGDLFEVWIGDDVIGSSAADPASNFEMRCAQVLQNTSRRLSVFFMHGNRDFLLGPAFASACGITLLADPCVLEFANQRWLLSHGDALCLQDTDYMRFRAQVRNAQWQKEFLEQPLIQRQKLARAMREQSQSRKNDAMADGMALVDLDTPATCNWLDATATTTMIHGHTHSPAEHMLAAGKRRIVLSDWDGSATPARAEVLRLISGLPDQAASVQVQRVPLAIA